MHPDDKKNKRTLNPILLHPYHDIAIIINVETVYRNRTQPTSLENNKKISKMELLTDERNTYIGHSITINNELICHEIHFMYFIETLNCFTSKLLDTDLIYQIKYKDENTGYIARITQKEKEDSKNNTKKVEYYLKIESAQGAYIYLTKYDCKVIINKFNKLYSKCFPSDLI